MKAKVIFAIITTAIACTLIVVFGGKPKREWCYPKKIGRHQEIRVKRVQCPLPSHLCFFFWCFHFRIM